MIPKEEKEGWHYVAVKKLPTLSRGITSNIMVIFIAWIVFLLFEQKNKLKSLEKKCKNKGLWGTIMPSEKNNILEFNQYIKLDKTPYTIYADMESFI